MNKNNLIKDFQNRNLIAQITKQTTLEKKLNSEKITLYCGFDPTADSLHLGHLVPLLCLKRFQLSGHRLIIVIGGATGLIGDPSFKIIGRHLNSIDTIKTWTEKIKKQIYPYFDFHHTNNNAIIVNNCDWFSSMNMLSFLRNVGKHFSINKMINKEAIKQRLKRNNIGISFTEFSYNLLQSYDFKYLYETHNAILQIGGSDQWGNITSGIDLIYRIYRKHAYGLTVPLITKSNNIKFGKTEKKTIWLDKAKTSPYKFYQFLINTPDDEVYHFLKLFTLLDTTTINNLELENKISNNTLRHQIILATEVTNLVHGQQELKIVQQITKNLFEKNFSQLQIQDFIQLENRIPTTTLHIRNTDLQSILVITNISISKYQSRTLIKSNSIFINGKRVREDKYILHTTDRIYNRYTLLQKGKKYFHLIRWDQKN